MLANPRRRPPGGGQLRLPESREWPVYSVAGGDRLPNRKRSPFWVFVRWEGDVRSNDPRRYHHSVATFPNHDAAEHRARELARKADGGVFESRDDRERRADRQRRGINPRRTAMHRNPSYLGVHIPSKIAGLPGGLVVAAAAIAAYMAFTRSGGGSVGSVLGGGSKAAHSSAMVNPQTGMLYQHSRPNTPPAAAQGMGEWVAVNCPDHGSPGVCWAWEPLSTVSLPGIPVSL